MQLEKIKISCNGNVIVMHSRCYISFPCFYNTIILIYAQNGKQNVWNTIFDTKTLAKSISLYFITTMRPFSMTTKALLSHYLRTRFIVIWCKRRRRRGICTRWFSNFCFWCFCMWICMNGGFNLWYSWDLFVVYSNLWGYVLDTILWHHVCKIFYLLIIYCMNFNWNLEIETNWFFT